jgi:hypothetical protein
MNHSLVGAGKLFMMNGRRWFNRKGEGEMKMVSTKLKKELNSFLNFWLGNLKKQGFFKKHEPPATTPAAQ